MSIGDIKMAKQVRSLKSHYTRLAHHPTSKAIFGSEK